MSGLTITSTYTGTSTTVDSTHDFEAVSAYPSMPVFPEPTIYIVTDKKSQDTETMGLPVVTPSLLTDVEVSSTDQTGSSGRPKITTSTTASMKTLPVVMSRLEAAKPLSTTLPVLTNTNITVALPVVIEPTASIGNISCLQPGPSGSTDKDVPDIIHGYIETLTVEGDNILYLHTKDILANKCMVQLDKLNLWDVADLQAELKATTETTTQQETDDPLVRKESVLATTQNKNHQLHGWQHKKS